MKNNKDIVLEILSKTKVITIQFLEELKKTYGVDFEILSLPRFSFHPINQRIRLFQYDGKIFK